MFCEGPHTSGNDGWSAATPPSVPRKRGQLSSAADAAAMRSAAQHTVLATRAFRVDMWRLSCAAIGAASTAGGVNCPGGGFFFRTRAAEDAAHDMVIALMARELVKVVLR